jgi:zinc transport system ATP-binding protein
VPAASPLPSSSLIACRRLVVGHRGRGLLPPFDLSIGAGELMIVVGRNGSGKTTFARTLLGLVAPVAGSVTAAASRLAYVPQVAAIDPAIPLRVKDLVGWGRLRGWDSIGDLRNHRLSELSGGQLQRVLLARMLAGDAQLAVLDEPTAAMDALSELAAFRRLRELAHERGIGIVIVTHEVAVAAPFADSIAFFDPDHGQGQVLVGAAGVVASNPRFCALFGRVDAGEVIDAAG